MSRPYNNWGDAQLKQHLNDISSNERWYRDCADIYRAKIADIEAELERRKMTTVTIELDAEEVEDLRTNAYTHGTAIIILGKLKRAMQQRG